MDEPDNRYEDELEDSDFEDDEQADADNADDTDDDVSVDEGARESEDGVHPANQRKIYREEKLIRYIAENLVNDPDAVTLTRQRKGRTIVLELNVAPNDMGRVIGRSGRVANAMRSLLRSMSTGRQRIVLDIE